MEFSLREWLILIGVLIIVGILVDGFRRYRKGQQQAMAPDDGEFVDPEELLKEATLKRELPNGGARPARGGQGHDPVRNAFETAKKTANAPLTDLPHKVDAGPTLQKDDELHLDELESLVPERLSATRDVELEKDYSDVTDDDLDIGETDDYYKENAYSDSYQDDEDFERHYSNVDIDQITPSGPTQALQEEDFQSEIEEVIVINVFAKEGKTFAGMDLLQLVLNCGMRYGEMDIFHRHEDGFDRGKVQFSMANAVEPGTFDLDAMGESSSPGVSFFMGLPGPKNSMRAFDYMLETAQALVRNLDGELRDERRSLMSSQTIEHCRQRIRDFERRRLTKPKAG